MAVRSAILRLRSPHSLPRPESTNRTTRHGSGWARYWAVVFAAGCYGLLGFAIVREPKYEIVEEHHVKVLSQVSPNSWAMSSDEEGSFLYTGCNDFPNATVIWAGYIADRAKWEERGECKSIRATGLGFYWERDEHYNAKEIPR